MQSEPAIVAFVNSMYDAFKRGDTYALAEFVSKDLTTMIGTDPEEYWIDHDSAYSVMRDQINATGGVIFMAGTIMASREEDIGWFADQPLLIVGDHEVECRHTGVVRREHGMWRLVQDHPSIGVPNSDVFGDLPL